MSPGGPGLKRGVMAYPASARADSGPGPREPRKSDPNSPGWANIRNLLASEAERAGLSIAELAARPGCHMAARRAELIAVYLGELAEIVRRCVIDEDILKEAEQRAYAQGVADCKAARCNLTVVGGR